MKIREILPKRELACCTAKDTAVQAAKLMKQHDVGLIPVVNDTSAKKLEGVITDRDLCLRLLAEERAPSTTLDQCMSRNGLHTAKLDDDVSKAEELMSNHQVRRIVIVDEQGSCQGVLSQADLARREQADKVKQVVSDISQPPQKAAA